MDYSNHRAGLVSHLMMIRSVQPEYARWVLPRYARLEHLFNTGFEEEVKARWSQLHPESPSW